MFSTFAQAINRAVSWILSWFVPTSKQTSIVMDECTVDLVAIVVIPTNPSRQTTASSNQSVSGDHACERASVTDITAQPTTFNGRYTVEKTLAYGDVKLCRDNITDKQVIIKRAGTISLASIIANQSDGESDESYPDLDFSDDSDEMFANLLLSQDGGHPHILSTETHFDHDGDAHLVFDFCAGGDLHDLVHVAKVLPNDVALRYFRQIVSGVDFMHDRGLAHRDLSLDNILLDDDNNALVSDFGTAVNLPGLCELRIGKWDYMAPEVFENRIYDPSLADVWCLGVMLYRMLAGEFPFRNEESRFDPDVAFLEEHGLKALVEKCKGTHLFEPDALDLLHQMLHPNPFERLAMFEVKYHAYLCGPEY
jgi:calcium-dependent protein kinase